MPITISGSGITMQGTGITITGAIGTVAVIDLYFPYVTLLLSGDGTNAAQNNTFTDSSTNNFTVTRTGTPTQGSFSPYGVNWSNYFPATSSLQAPSGSSISGTGNFTLELWINPTTFASGYQAIYANDTSGGFSFTINSTGTLGYGRSLIATDGTTTGTVTFNQWNHIAFVRSGTGASQFICYINGVSAGSFTNSTSYAAGIVRIGTDGGGSSFPYTGYISNLRSNTTAVYTSTFTPPTAPLTAVANTSLLTCQSNRFKDNSTSTFAVTVAGSPSVQRFSPFNPDSAYSTTVIGGSGYFNGTSDGLLVPSSSSFAFGSSNFTIEFWYYPTSTAGTNPNIMCNNSGSGSFVSGQWSLHAPHAIYANKYSLWVASFSTGAALLVSTSNIATNTWTHIGVVRNGNAWALYLNGVSEASATHSGILDNGTSNPQYIGYQPNVESGRYITGYISNLRLVKGTAVYTTTFTPPTSPVTAVANTSLLTNFADAGIYDSSEMNNLTTVGSAQASTSTFKYGTASMKFNGTTDYLTIPASTSFNFGSGDFTIEAWVYAVSWPTTIYFAGQSNTSDYAPVLPFFTSGKPGLAATSASGSWAVNSFGSAPTLSTATWYHVAWVRYGNEWSVYVNGTKYIVAASTAVTVYTSTDSLAISTNGNRNNYFFNGYIDDFRITKGYARYTATFTPPTAALPTQ